MVDQGVSFGTCWYRRAVKSIVLEEIVELLLFKTLQLHLQVLELYMFTIS